MNLYINVVTRGRPERLQQTIARTLPLIAEDTTRMVVSIDDDDESTQELRAWLDDQAPRVIVDSRPREDALGAKWDRVIGYEDADIFLPMADYTPYVTPAFDSKIIGAATLFPDAIGCVYTNMANASFARSQAPTRKLVEKLGYMYPPYFPYWFVDHWLDDVVKLIDRISFADVDVDSGPAKLPTQELREVGFWATFYDSQRLARRRAARAIIDDPEFLEPEWRKELLRCHYPLVEFRSQCINDTVRAMTWPANPNSGGERYLRMKQQALKMMAAEWPLMEKELAH